MKLTPVASVLAMVALAVATGAATASSGRPLLLAGTHTPAYKPASFCPANHSCFTRARWTRWGATARATAHGTTVSRRAHALRAGRRHPLGAAACLRSLSLHAREMALPEAELPLRRAMDFRQHVHHIGPMRRLAGRLDVTAVELRRAWVLGGFAAMTAALLAATFPVGASAATRTGVLRITVGGLPSGERPCLTVSGPGIRRHVSAAVWTLARARPGRVDAPAALRSPAPLPRRPATRGNRIPANFGRPCAPSARRAHDHRRPVRHDCQPGPR